MNNNINESVKDSQAPVVEFVNYTGSYPNLCSGELTIKIDGEVFTLPRHSLIPGGSVWFEDGDERVEYGPWTIRELPDELTQLKDVIEQIINDNISWACCGGCI